MTSKLYVGNLEYSVTEAELKSLFAEKAEVTECKVIEGKGFAFLSFKDFQTANSIKEEFNGVEFKGRPLKIDNARENQSRGGGGGRGGPRGGGGFNRERSGGGGFRRERY